MQRQSITIVGASLAGLRAAETLRRDGFDGSITLIGDEPDRPYDRPPLSKQVLAGEWEPSRVDLADDDKYATLDLELLLGVPATGLDVASRTLTLGDSTTLEYDGLLIATGARTRSLPGTEDMRGVFTLRTRDDSAAIAAAFDAGPERLVVVGAGFIGLEVAATARERGIAVTMVEMEEVPLGRILGDEIGSVITEIHREHDVDLRTGVGVDHLDADDDGNVRRVHLSDGSAVDADVVVVGIGVIPNTEWLIDSGLEIDNGVVCDATTLAAPDVVAAGDVARWPNQRFDEMMRVEHWDNAVEMGSHAARRLLVDDDDAVAFTPTPWFWSDQYDRKIQLAGRARPTDDVAIVNGTFEERRFAAIYGREGRICAIFGMNRPRHVMQYRGLIDQGASWDEALAFGQDT